MNSNSCPIQLASAFLMLIAFLISASSRAETVCAELSRVIDAKKDTSMSPARRPTKEETRIIEKSKLDILGFNDYAVGVDIVDIDNDGREDVFAWSVAGSGRFLSAEIHSFITGATGTSLERKGFVNLGVLQFPRFFRLRGTNYIVASGEGDSTTNYAAKISIGEDERPQLTTVCRMQTILAPRSSCRHPACKTLIDDQRQEAQ